MAVGLVSAAPRRMRRALALAPGWWIAGFAVIAALMLAIPGQTVATRGLAELLGIFDGIHRVQSGQVPGRDFQTTLGPLAFWLPALGAGIAGFGGALPVAMALVLLALAPVMVHVLTSRLPAMLALPTGLLLVLILAVPITPGDGIMDLSFATFDTRIGWAAFSLLLIMYLRPERPAPVRDAASGAGLVLLMILVQPIFGMAALAFIVLLLLDPGARRWAAGALATVLLAVPAVTIVWEGGPGTLQSLGMAFGVGGVLRGSWGEILDHFLANGADYTLLGLLAGLSLWRRPSLRDAGFFVFCALAGFWIINHCAQRWGIFSLYAGAAVAAARLLALPDDVRQRPWTNPAGTTLAYVALLLPPLVHFSAALVLHAWVAVAGTGQSLPLPQMEGVRLANLWTNGSFGGAMWYLDGVEEGMAALAETEEPERLLVLGGPDPFSAALGLRPAAGVMPDMRWNDTVGPEYHPAPAGLLRDVEIVAERRSAGGPGPVADPYLPYVAEQFRVVAETEHWRFHRRRAEAP